MYLTPGQWATIRKIASEQARKMLDDDTPEVRDAFISYGFTPSQASELNRIIRGTIVKAQRQRSLALEGITLVSLDDALRSLTKTQGEKLDRQMAANDELRTRLEEKNERLRQADKLVREMNDKILEQAATILQMIPKQDLEVRIQPDPVLEASFENHLRCQFDLGDYRGSGTITGRVTVENGKWPPDSVLGLRFNDGDRAVSAKEIFTWFRGAWRRKSELEGFASAKKYL